MAFAPLFTPIRVGFLSLAVVVAGLAPASAQTTGAQTPPAPAGATPRRCRRRKPWSRGSATRKS